MTLGQKQREFTLLVSYLIAYAYENGCELTFGDAYRDPRVHGQLGQKESYSSAYSNHKQRLAIDLNLFVDGEYITDGDHPKYKELGEYWESLGGAWGGRFNDANHFSMEHHGRK